VADESRWISFAVRRSMAQVRFRGQTGKHFLVLSIYWF
jgi:hypothetical protein